MHAGESQLFCSELENSVSLRKTSRLEDHCAISYIFSQFRSVPFLRLFVFFLLKGEETALISV